MQFPVSVSGVWAQYFEKFDPVAITDKYFENWAKGSFSKHYEQIVAGRSQGLPDGELKLTRRSTHANGVADGSDPKHSGGEGHFREGTSVMLNFEAI